MQECLLREKNMILQLENHIFSPKPGERHTLYILPIICPPILLLKIWFFPLAFQIFSRHRKDIKFWIKFLLLENNMILFLENHFFNNEHCMNNAIKEKEADPDPKIFLGALCVPEIIGSWETKIWFLRGRGEIYNLVIK